MSAGAVGWSGSAGSGKVAGWWRGGWSGGAWEGGVKAWVGGDGGERGRGDWVWVRLSASLFSGISATEAFSRLRFCSMSRTVVDGWCDTGGGGLGEGLGAREWVSEDGGWWRHCCRNASIASSGRDRGLVRLWMGMGGAISGEGSRGLEVVTWEVDVPELGGAGDGDNGGEWSSTWRMSSCIGGEDGGDWWVGESGGERETDGVAVAAEWRIMDWRRLARSSGLEEVMVSIMGSALAAPLVGAEDSDTAGDGSGEADRFRFSWARE